MKRSDWMAVIVTVGLIASGPMAAADSLFTQEAAKAGTLVSEKVARFEVGDIITVLVREEITASTQANTDTQKESDVESEADQGDNTFLTTPDSAGGFGILSPGKLPNWQFETENESRLGGQTRRTSTLTTTITCVVTNVGPKGLIQVSGQKLLKVNREDTTLHLDGIVRSRDVTSNNTVLSTQMANMALKLEGKGPLWNTQRRGLITKFLDWISPF